MSVVAVLRSVRGAQGLKTPTQSTIWWPTSNSRHGSRCLDQLRSITSTYKDLDHSAAYENLRRRPHDEEVWLDDLKCYQRKRYYFKNTNDRERKGFVKVQYQARRTRWSSHEQKILYSHVVTRPLVIIYSEDCIPEDDGFWPEVKLLCDFACAITELENDVYDTYFPARDIRDPEIICVFARFHYDFMDPNEPWHVNCRVGNRKTWDSGGEGYFRGPFHVYAKDDDLANGYGGYCLSSFTPGANKLVHIPGGVLPRVRPNAQGNIVSTRLWVRNPETRCRLSDAMTNEVLIPDGQLWDGLRPQPTPSSPLRSKGRDSRHAKPEDFIQIVDALQRGLMKPARAGWGSHGSLEKAVSTAVKLGDATVIKWALQHFKRGERGAKTIVPTVGGTLRGSRSRKLRSATCRRTSAKWFSSVRAGLLMGAKEIGKHLIAQRNVIQTRKGGPDRTMTLGKAMEKKNAGPGDKPSRTETHVARNRLRRIATQNKKNTRLRHTVLQINERQSDDPKSRKGDQEFTSMLSRELSHEGLAKRAASQSHQERQVSFDAIMKSITSRSRPDQQASCGVQKSLPRRPVVKKYLTFTRQWII